MRNIQTKLTTIIPAALLALLSTLNSQLSTLFAQGTTFTYQGRLTVNGSLANGNYDLRFNLYTNSAGGSPVTTGLTNPAVTVANGLFTTTLDFGSVFNGTIYWLDIGARTNGSAVAFVGLTTRQQLTPSPYAVFAGSAGLANSLAGNAVTTTSIANGAVVRSLNGLTDTVNLSAGSNVLITTSGNSLQISSTGAVSSGWALVGNAGTTSGNFLGTVDNQPLELKVKGARALRLEPTTAGAPNVIGGAAVNFVASGSVGATIGGGGGVDSFGNIYTNSVTGGDFGTVAGGYNNASRGFGATVGGGYGNTSSTYATVGGGQQNSSSDWYATVAGGYLNTSSGGSTVGGGDNNRSIGASATVGGGEHNTSSGQLATVGGGYSNTSSGDQATVGGGAGNISSAAGAFIGGGGFDGFSRIANVASGSASTVVGGLGNSATNQYSTVGGGKQNTNSGYAATICGGQQNVSSHNFATVGGGLQNSSGAYATVGGGYDNSSTGTGAFIGGGGHDGSTVRGNVAGGAASTVTGGHGNSAGGDYSTVSGGQFNTASGGYSTIPGGSGNTAPGFGSFAAGINAHATHPASFVWGDGTQAANSTAGNTFSVLAKGGVGFYVNSGSVNIAPDGTLSCKVLTISGADVAEPFEISTKDIPKGSVVIIDENNPGQLTLSDRPYDTRVAGILSGANGVRAGICLSQQGFNDGGQNVALSGRVYVLADASNSPIKPGDLLTTSNTPGHAMKVTDHAKAQGAIIGKAMSALPNGKGMVLVLVTLQ